MSNENITEEEAEQELKKGYKKAEKLLKDKDKTGEFLINIEKKLKTVPALGDTLAIIPTMISLIRSYLKKEYTKVPIGTIIAIISALIYFLAIIDLIPDTLPGIGYLDDATVIAACLKWVSSDLDDYIKWRDNKEL